MENIKTFENWKGNLYEYLEPGDTVEEKIVDYLINSLPPKAFNYAYVQGGGAITFDTDGISLYMTFIKHKGNRWEYKGLCRGGEIKPRQAAY